MRMNHVNMLTFLHDSPFSRHSRNKVSLRMINRTDRVVDIIWINYTGEYIKYNEVGPQETINLNTYETHPWIAIDSETKERLFIGGEYIYMPSGTVLKRLPPDVPRPLVTLLLNHTRFPIYISSPLLSLHCKALLVLRSCLENVKDVDTLGLPKPLAMELKYLMKEKIRYDY